MDTITILKRSNGMYGIYINGNGQEHLACNSSLQDRSYLLIDMLIDKQAQYPNAKIIFTDKEEGFKSRLPQMCILYLIDKHNNKHINGGITE